MFVIDSVVASFNGFMADMTYKLFAIIIGFGISNAKRTTRRKKDSELKTAIICRGVAMVGITAMHWRHYENYIENSRCFL